VYTCAYYPTQTETLEQAQHAKLDTYAASCTSSPVIA
jgi:cyclopropane fatty-acyl-phospholipid synthase-like methyltransferase